MTYDIWYDTMQFDIAYDICQMHKCKCHKKIYLIYNIIQFDMIRYKIGNLIYII